MRNEMVTFARDTAAVMVPDGTEATISAGMQGRITQALGTSFTVVTSYGQMFRIENGDADAVGKDPEDFAMDLPTEGSLEDQVWAQLTTCYDPEIPVNIVDLGLVYSCDISPIPDSEDQRIEIKMTLTAPGCPVAGISCATCAITQPAGRFTEPSSLPSAPRTRENRLDFPVPLAPVRPAFCPGWI